MSKFIIDESDLNSFLGKPPSISIAEVEGFAVSGDVKQDQELAELQKLSALLDQYEKASHEAGIHKWFVPGTPYGIEHCHKHRAFFDAGADYNERLFLAANR